jgi:hypothetical protein
MPLEFGPRPNASVEQALPSCRALDDLEQRVGQKALRVTSARVRAANQALLVMAKIAGVWHTNCF